MANENPVINPNIAEAGKATQFGAPGGPDPVEAGKKGAEAAHSTRAHLRYIASQPISNDISKLDDELARLRELGDGTTTLARMNAVRLFERALKNRDSNAAVAVIENTEGKLAQEIVLPNNKPLPFGGTLEEASRIFREGMSK